MLSVDKSFLCKLILVIKLSFASAKKKPAAHAHLNRFVGPYIEDIIWSFDTVIWFCAVYNKRETEYNVCTIFNLYAHAQLKRIKKTKLQTINISCVTLCHSTSNMTPSLKSKYIKDL